MRQHLKCFKISGNAPGKAQQQTTRLKNTAIVFFLILLTFVQPSFAQSYSGVNGTITDNQHKALASVTVSLLDSKDSSLVKAGVTNADGKFDIPFVKGGSYLLSYDAVGFKKKYTVAFTLKPAENISVKTESLEIAAESMSSVTVISKKPLIDVKPDKTVFNVESSINATGSSAMELLQKSPGILVDNDDNISMKGKNGVRIYVDGRMMQLDSKDLTAYLKSINSSDIEAIEMITSPGARYDASGNAGVINIRLKKNKKFGTNGSAGIGFIQGVTPKGNGALNLNYRDKKINVFANLGGSIGENQKLFDLNRIQKDTFYYAKTDFLSNDKSVNAKTGADLFIDSRSTVGLLATVNYTDEDYKSGTTTGIYDHSGQLIKSPRSSNTIPGSRTNADFNFNYHYANANGRGINADADYGLFRGTGKSYQPNYYYTSNNGLQNTVINRNYAPIDIDIYTVKLDMAQKLAKGKLEYGGKYAQVTTKNIYNFYVDDIDGKPNEVLDKSSNFAYSEKVNAAYANYQCQPVDKLAMQAGLRIEQTNSNGNLTRADGIVKADNNVKKNYIDFFPNASATWSINQNHTVNLAYNRRIDRPNYQDLNPFEIKLDELTYIKGNAFLRPQYTDNITLTHTLSGKVNTSIGYSHVKDFATQVTDTVGNTFYAQTKNIGKQRVFNFSIGSPFHFAKWWNAYAGAWYSYQLFDGAIDINQVHARISAFGANMQQSFTMGHDYSAEVTGWFNGPSLSHVTWKTKSMGGVDVGLQKLLFHKQSTIKISATDIFHTALFYASSNFGGVNGNASVHMESQTVRINFTWRFGSNQIKNNRERHTGLENETNRIGKSN